jgi:hypothetical protein
VAYRVVEEEEPEDDDDDDWISWYGQCPTGPVGVLPDHLVAVKLRDGSIPPSAAVEKKWWGWTHTGGPGDIMAYRVVEEEEEPEDDDDDGYTWTGHICHNCGHTFPVTPLVHHCPVCRHHYDYQFPL